MNKIRTRFAPSPTGSLHIGSLRTALYAYAMARKNGGDFILRIEDTDKKREVSGAKEEIMSTLKEFGLNWDELHIQSERVRQGIYQKAAEKLLKEGSAYYCRCEARNAKKDGYSIELRDPCREKGYKSGAVKLRVPENQEVSFYDFVIGKDITWSTKDVRDATLLKSDGFPTYHLAVVVDDNDMEISHVMRGYDWLPSTPIHILVYRYLGYKIPVMGHLTDILDPSGGKLSKRKGSVNVNEMISEGYLKEALLNYVILLGWAPKDDREFYSLDEFVESFSEEGFQKSNPIFDRKKLLWMNSQYIQKLPDQEIAIKISELYGEKYDIEKIKQIVPLIDTRIETLCEFEQIAGFFFHFEKTDHSLLAENASEHLSYAAKKLEDIESWDLESINETLSNLIEERNFKTGKFYMDLRVAVTGSKVTPPINESMAILGKSETITRLKAAIN